MGGGKNMGNCQYIMGSCVDVAALAGMSTCLETRVMGKGGDK